MKIKDHLPIQMKAMRQAIKVGFIFGNSSVLCPERKKIMSMITQIPSEVNSFSCLYMIFPASLLSMPNHFHSFNKHLLRISCVQIHEIGLKFNLENCQPSLVSQSDCPLIAWHPIHLPFVNQVTIYPRASTRV